jgi:hypothetical protein
MPAARSPPSGLSACFFGGDGGRREMGDNYIGIKMDQLRAEIGGAVNSVHCLARQERKVLTFRTAKSRRLRRNSGCIRTI